jgi:hypothetical protein
LQHCINQTSLKIYENIQWPSAHILESPHILFGGFQTFEHILKVFQNRGRV